MGDAFHGLAVMALVGVCAIPLAVWKVIDIILWVAAHLHWE